MTAPILLFLGTHADEPYLPRLKNCVGAATVFLQLTPILTIAEVILYCKKRNITGVISTNKTLLIKLLGAEKERKQPSLDSYAGSRFIREGIEIVFINPLEQFITVPYGPFVARRFISKLASPELWTKSPEFSFEILTPSNVDAIFARFQSAYLIAYDLETLKDPVRIDQAGYTAVFISPAGDITTHSVVLEIKDQWSLAWFRKFNWELKAPKITQNGKYDMSYSTMYSAPVYNWLWDTANMMHCWYSELPKDLAFLNAFFVREAMYWKDMAASADRKDQLEYNCRDTWATAVVAMNWIMQAPAWAKRNYVQEFPLNFPCHMAEMTGVKRDMNRLIPAHNEIESRIQRDTESICKLTATPNLNVGSPKQVKQLLKILGCGDLESTDETHLKKAALRHAINSRIVNKILDIRGDRKLISTYLTEGKEFNGRILYALNPHGTDTGRLASREHHFWCGLQIQNIPRGKEVKQTISSDPDFRFAEVDLEQAESRDTAHIAGDENLIAAVSGERDFHSVNASAFFGVPYETIYSQELRKTINKALRDLAKRVNHGANYLMGAGVLLDTMGEDNVVEAKGLLNLPRSWSLKQVCEYLLEKFHQTYPKLSAVFYPAVVHEVVTTRMLQSRAYHHTEWDADTETYKVREDVREDEMIGWTRYCFGDPQKNKRDKNALVAHVPQSLNAMTLNKAFMRVFYDIAINPTHSKDFKLCAQIHDSILFQFREGKEFLADMVRQRMEIPVTIKGYDSKVRTFVVPAAIKAGKDNKGSLYWSDTE